MSIVDCSPRKPHRDRRILPQCQLLEADLDVPYKSFADDAGECKCCVLSLPLVLIVDDFFFFFFFLRSSCPLVQIHQAITDIGICAEDEEGKSCSA